jgi:hypothetical protein
LKLLVPVDDPAAPLDVGLAQDTPDAAWTWTRKQGVSSSNLGRMAHLLGLEVDAGRTIGVGEGRAAIAGETRCGPVRFGAKAGWSLSLPKPAMIRGNKCHERMAVSTAWTSSLVTPARKS